MPPPARRRWPRISPTHRSEIARLLGALEAISRTPPPQRGAAPARPARRGAGGGDDGPPVAGAQRPRRPRWPASSRRSRAARDGPGRRRGRRSPRRCRGSTRPARRSPRRWPAAVRRAEVGPADPTPTHDGPRQRVADRARGGAGRDGRRAAGARPRRRAGRRRALRLAGRGQRSSSHFNEPDAAGVRRPGIVRRAPRPSRWSPPRPTRSCATPGPFLEYGASWCSSPIPRRWWCSPGSTGCRCGPAPRSARRPSRAPRRTPRRMLKNM